MRGKKNIPVCMLIMMLMAGAINAQDVQYARQLSISHKYREAEQAYNHILQTHPGNTDALLGAAHNYAWMGKHRDAGKTFHRVLAADPLNLEALVGRAYNLAWAGEYEQARQAFAELQQQYPDHIEIAKGLAYVSLWEGQTGHAAKQFENLVLQSPHEVSYHIALAQAYLAENKSDKAYSAIQNALQIDPANATARRMLSDITLHPALLEADIHLGFSAAGSEQKLGIRAVGLSGQINKKLRMWLRYDNSLSMDIAALAQSNRHIQLVTLGSALDWKNNMLSRLDYTLRLLPERNNQHLVTAEQVFFLPKRWSARIGGNYGFPTSDSPKEWLLFSGIHVPTGRFFSFEPTFFVSRPSASPGTEYRVFLNQQYRTSTGYELNAGLLFGQVPLGGEPGITGNIYGAMVNVLLPFNRKLWAMATTRFEAGDTDKLFLISLGIKRRFE